MKERKRPSARNQVKEKGRKGKGNIFMQTTAVVECGSLAILRVDVLLGQAGGYESRGTVIKG